MNPPLAQREVGRVALWISVLAAAAIVAELACASTPAPPRSRPSLLSGVQAHPAYPSPATWRYHPKREAGLVARRELGGDRVLLAGERGERWLVDEKGRAQAAAQLAPESLIVILTLPGGGLLFVGESGTGYETLSPLGAFVRSSAPLDPVVGVTAADSAIAAVRRDGALVRSADAGATWQKVGPDGEWFADVVLLDGGHGLALSVPERLWRSEDSGANWTPLDVDSVGALGFARDKKAGLVIEAALGWHHLDPATGVARLGRNRIPERHELPKKPPRGPDAEALVSGRAAFISGHYLELEQDEKDSDEWRLWHGRADGRLRSERIKQLHDCRTTRVAGYDRWLTFACHRGSSSSSTQKFVFYRSDDRGKTYEREDFRAYGRADTLRMAMGAEGALLVTGVCPPHNASSGCSAQGVLYRRKIPADAGAEEAGKRTTDDEDEDEDDDEDEDGDEDDDEDDDEPEYELALAATPTLKRAASQIAFSTDGSVAYAVGRRSKNRAYALFVSTDGGQTFEAREIEQLGQEATYGDEGEDEEYRSYYARPSRPAVRSLAPAEDGSVAIVLHLSDRPVLVVADDQGRVVSLARPPGADLEIGAVGTRALSFSTSSRKSWETVDGGANWNPIGRLPVQPCGGRGDCEVTVACHLGGCVIGAELSRLGWHGQADDDQGVLAPPDSGRHALYDSRLRTPLSCSLHEKTWQSIPQAASAPDPYQMAIGDAAWFLPIQDAATAAASALHGRGGKRPRVETISLLNPVQDPGRYAFAVGMSQVEGVTAIRYRVPDSVRVEAQLRNVEVAWDNLIEGKIVRTKIPDAGPYRPGDFSGGEGGAQRARPDLVSIASGGVYVRIHQSARSAQPTLFLDGRTVASVPSLSWPSVSGSTSHPEMAHVGGAHVPITFLGRGTGVVRARHQGGQWAFDAMAAGLHHPDHFGLTQTSTLAYSDGRSGYHVQTYDASGRYHRGRLFLFRADGAVLDPPIAVPMQGDTGDQPIRCSDRRRASTPRVVAPYQPGTRHPVVVVDVEEPLRVMISGPAVMHGTPEAPCMAALSATIVAVDGGPEPQGEQAVIPLDDLEHAWLFRKVTDEFSGQSEVEYRLMSCRFDPRVHVPLEIYEAPGVRVLRRY